MISNILVICCSRQLGVSRVLAPPLHPPPAQKETRARPSSRSVPTTASAGIHLPSLPSTTSALGYSMWGLPCTHQADQTLHRSHSHNLLDKRRASATLGEDREDGGRWKTSPGRTNLVGLGSEGY
jgi:hypothetical protein